MTRLALCGGVYSNPYALRAFVEQARARGADRLFWLGDFGGADLATSPDFRLGGLDVSMAEATRRVMQRFLELRQADGSLPVVLNCAV